jgi:peptidoglycan-N-acetylglucosamine deacetylase
MPRQHLVCLTFDFDAMSGFVARKMMTPTPVSRGEFGAVGVERLLALLASRDIVSSWFIPGVVLGTYPELCARIHAAGHEIGHHGWTHVTPASLSREEELDALRRGNDAIAEVTGQQARGYRSPAWDLSAHTIELLLQEGFIYESSMMGHDYLPYQARRGDIVREDGPMTFGEPTPLVEMPISWTLDDHPHFEFIVSRNGVMPGLQNASNVLENWLDDFHYMQRELDWGVITYTCHPLVIGRGHRMLMLERLINTLAEQGGEFVTLETAVARYQARKVA